jgi:hypothetical protein
MSYKTYTKIIKECKIQNIDANIGKIQADIKRGIDKDFIINNLEVYI